MNTENKNNIHSFFASHPGSEYTIEETCARILTDGHGKSSVYRIISEMVEEGKLKRITDPHSRRVCYQHIEKEHCSEHLHLKCQGCGRLIHLDDETSHSLQESLMRSKNFEIDSGAMLFGRCESCIYKKEERK